MRKENRDFFCASFVWPSMFAKPVSVHDRVHVGVFRLPTSVAGETGTEPGAGEGAWEIVLYSHRTIRNSQGRHNVLVLPVPSRENVRVLSQPLDISGMAWTRGALVTAAQTAGLVEDAKRFKSQLGLQPNRTWHYMNIQDIAGTHNTNFPEWAVPSDIISILSKFYPESGDHSYLIVALDHDGEYSPLSYAYRIRAETHPLLMFPIMRASGGKALGFLSDAPELSSASTIPVSPVQYDHTLYALSNEQTRDTAWSTYHPLPHDLLAAFYQPQLRQAFGTRACVSAETLLRLVSEPGWVFAVHRLRGAFGSQDITYPPLTLGPLLRPSPAIPPLPAAIHQQHGFGPAAAAPELPDMSGLVPPPAATPATAVPPPLLGRTEQKRTARPPAQPNSSIHLHTSAQVHAVMPVSGVIPLGMALSRHPRRPLPPVHDTADEDTEDEGVLSRFTIDDLPEDAARGTAATAGAGSHAVTMITDDELAAAEADRAARVQAQRIFFNMMHH